MRCGEGGIKVDSWLRAMRRSSVRRDGCDHGLMFSEALEGLVMDWGWITGACLLQKALGG